MIPVQGTSARACIACTDRAVRQREARAAVRLTPRQLEVLALLAEGLTNEQIARRLWLTPNTVKSHVHTLHVRLGAGTNAEVVAKALRAGVIE